MSHNGLPVSGYKPQSDEAVALVNENKILEERILRQIEKLQMLQSIHENSGGTKNLFDPRMLAIARTGIQEACMWLNRAVFQPGRIALPEDEN